MALEASIPSGVRGTLSRRHLFMVAIAIGCGVAGALGAVVFRWLIELSQALFFGGAAGIASFFAGTAPRADDLVEIARARPWWWVVLAPAVGGALVGLLVYRFAREARGHGVPGVPEVM
jgi:CIC family chloride channel protein